MAETEVKVEVEYVLPPTWDEDEELSNLSSNLLTNEGISDHHHHSQEHTYDSSEEVGKVEVEEGADDDVVEKLKKKTRPKKRRNTRLSRLISGKHRRRRKLLSEMTPEEAEAARAKTKADARRLKLNRAATDEEREALKATWKKSDEREQHLETVLANLPKEKLAEVEEIKTKIGGTIMTSKSGRLRTLLRTEEQRAAARMKAYFSKQAKLAQMTPEEREGERLRVRKYRQEQLLKHRATLEEIEAAREKCLQYKANMTPEKREEFLAKQRKAAAERTKEMRENNPEKYKEFLAEVRERKRRTNFFYGKIRRGTISDEEKKDVVKWILSGKGKALRYEGLTNEEIIKKWFDARREALKRAYMQKREKKIKTLGVVPVKTERLSREEITLRKRIREAKNRTLKKLQAMGASPEEIERRLIEAVEICKAKPILPYKPRPERMKPAGVKKKKEVASSSRAALAGNDYDDYVNDGIEHSSSQKRRGRPKKTANLTPEAISSTITAEHQASPSLESPLVDSQDRDNRPGTSYPQPHPFQIHHQQVQQRSHQVGRGSTAMPDYNMQPFNYLNFYDTHRNNTSQLSPISAPFDSTTLHHQQQHFNHDHSSSESFEPMMAVSPASPAHSYDDADVSSPQQGETSNEANCVEVKPKPTPNPPALLPLISSSAHERKPAIMQSTDFSSPDTTVAPPPPIIPSTNQKFQRPHVAEGRSYFQAGLIRGPQLNRSVREPRDSVCDVCGIAFSRTTLIGHKRLYHNPHFKDNRCLICGEHFSTVREWFYKHFRVLHPEYEIKTVRARKNGLRTRSKAIKVPDDSKERPFLCDQCGKGFTSPYGVQLHKKFAHREIPIDNYFSCEVCGKRFKRKSLIDKHLFREHGRGKTYQCEKCSECFGTHKLLKEHLRKDHLDALYPCGYCSALLLSELAKKSHTVQCKKVPRDTLKELRQKWIQEGSPAIDSTFIGCEFCKTHVTVGTLRRHYQSTHGLEKEHDHKCSQCDRTFITREFYICHLESVHRIPLEECLNIARPYKGDTKGGIKEPKLIFLVRPDRNPLRGRKRRKKTPEEKLLAKGKRRGRKPKRKVLSDDDDDDELSNDEETLTVKKTIKVEIINREEAEAFTTSRSRRKSSVKAEKRIRRANQDLSSSEEEDEDINSDDGWQEEEVEVDLTKRIKQEVDWKLYADCYVPVTRLKMDF